MAEHADTERPTLAPLDHSRQGNSSSRAFYHATHRRNLDAIIEHGLLPSDEHREGTNWEEYSIMREGVYLSPAVSMAESFRRHTGPQQLKWSPEEVVILRVDDLTWDDVVPDPEHLVVNLSSALENYDDPAHLESESWYQKMCPLMSKMPEGWDDESFDKTGSDCWQAFLMLTDEERQAVATWVKEHATLSVVHLGPISADRIQMMVWAHLPGSPDIEDICMTAYEDSTDEFADYYYPVAINDPEMDEYEHELNF